MRRLAFCDGLLEAFDRFEEPMWVRVHLLEASHSERRRDSQQPAVYWPQVFVVDEPWRYKLDL